MSKKLGPFDVMEQLCQKRPDIHGLLHRWVKRLIRAKNHLHGFHRNSSITAG